ncbi:Type II restriction/modification system, DNA methylase subunit YeeA [Epibacterium ulvae]|uniref:site-specific DNA-methyltransferase (adenine-specific) n=1 Tax=Epibacterium ulvae TaxID=1156985 RepID=A0A1G5PKC1_9RHOB|nr:DNA methyltransferase [Epibacterium ulvae]SCZ49509.1 Type II restriction/modification system, DNA methylase subunit YeeA [Epibacterium ulvae]
MLTPGEIYSNLDDLAASPPKGGAFGLELMEAVGAPRATITKLRDKAKDGEFVWTRMLRFKSTPVGGTHSALEEMQKEAEASPKSRRPRILLAYDGESIAAFDTRIADEPLRVGLDMLSLEGDLFFPLGGHERYVPAKEKLADVRATRFISRFHDAVRDMNPSWTSEKDRHALNIFMARILFCLFSDDVGIFEKDVFEKAVRQSTKVDGSDLAEFLSGAFQHMNTPPKDRPSETAGWSKLKYVNGSLFEEQEPMPTLDSKCRKLLLDCAQLNWKLINPDIFGSMLQAVVDVEKRGELGMHYTSPSNIMKVLEPILLDPLKSELERAGANKGKLRAFLERLGRIRVFDPACGSGNFLILAYKEMRALEVEALRRLAEVRLSGIQLEQFFGIEIDDFACQAARLGLWIAKYQCDQQLELDLGQRTDFLPLQKAGVIKKGNSAEVDWLDVCPTSENSETFLVGNPQFRGSSYWTPEQKADMELVFKGRVKNWGNLDYVTLWFAKARDYCIATGAPFAFVSTNSIVQGVQVPELWPHLLNQLEIKFAHRSFKWSNLAAHNAGVTCVIVSMGLPSSSPKRLFDSDTVRDVEVIGPYLAPNTTVVVAKTSTPIALLEQMTRGNQPTDGGNLILNREERIKLLDENPQAERFVRRLYGSQELMKGIERWCLWVADEEAQSARAIPELAMRFDAVATTRSNEKASKISKSFADRPHRFLQRPGAAQCWTILIPGAASEDRIWLPVDIKDENNIVSNLAFGIFDGAVWQAAVLSSRLHRLWLETVGGRLKEDPRYSNTLVWNTFPLPILSERRKSELEEHWWEIDLARKEAGWNKTLGNLYSPKEMPRALRRAHEELDETMETIFGSRRYRSDSDRIEHMLQLYERMIAEEAEKQTKKKKKETKT